MRIKLDVGGGEVDVNVRAAADSPQDGIETRDARLHAILGEPEGLVPGGLALSPHNPRPCAAKKKKKKKKRKKGKKQKAKKAKKHKKANKR
jgi:hypothetical protein